MFAVIYISDFSLQAVLRHEPKLAVRAIALIDPELPKPIIVQLTEAARATGVCEGLTAGQAMARCSELIIKTRSLAQERAATEVLLQTAYAFSPTIEATDPGICTLELKGMNFQSAGAREHWAEKILHTLASFHLRAQIGFAVTPALALLAARAAQSVLVVEKPEEFISHLPVMALSPSLEILQILQRWGIQTIGALLALGEDQVIERLGPEAKTLFDKVSLGSVRPLKTVVPPETFFEVVEFEHEIEMTEPLLFVLRRFIEQLSLRLGSVYLVVAELNLRLGLASGASYEHGYKIPAPTGNINVLFRMLQTHLETVRTDSPITSLCLSAKPGKPETHQFGLFETTLRDPNQFAETLAGLTALCGADRVGTPELPSTHKPDVFRMRVPDFTSSPTQNAKSEIQKPGVCLRRFRPPRPAYLEFREQRPALIRSEVFSGAVAEARGPFLSSGDWWDKERWAREEWDVETADGSLLRIFKSNDGCFVEGMYD